MILATAAPEELFRLPISNPVVVFAIAMISFVVAPLLFERFRVPGIIGLIVAGALVGPHGLGLLERDETIILLGTVGLLYLMFVAGIEIDLHGFARNRNQSLGFGLLTFAIPQAAGTAAGRMLGYPWPASILLGSMLASHTLVAYPIASRLGVAKNTAVTAAVGGTILTDLVSLLVLAVVAASTRGELGAAFWLRLVVSLAVFSALVMFGLPRLGRWFFRNEEDGETGAYVFILAALFVAAVLAEAAGVEPIIGAFLAGLSLNRLVPEGSPLSNRIHFFGSAVFIPFFLLSVGMLVDVRVFASGARAWVVMGAMTATVVGGKWAAARITQRLYGYGPEEGWMVFGLSVPQAAATLAAALIGHELKLFDTAVLNGAILMILVTCTLGPWTVERYGRRLALVEELRPYRPADAPQRILVPVASPGEVEALMDLAFLLRPDDSHEPLRVLTVVPPDGRGAAGRVAAAEKTLRAAAVYAAGADVPVDPLTRLDRNVVGGIVRGMAESRATVVVAGWDGLRNRRAGVMGDVHDALLERTDQQVLAARLVHPLNTTGRVLVIIPAHAERSCGFREAVATVKRVADRLGAPIEALVVGADPDRYRAHLDASKPDVPTTAERVAGWNALPQAVADRAGEDHLVVLVGVRRGTVGWEREMDRMPRRLSSLVSGNLLALYPSETEPDPVEKESREVFQLLVPSRVVFEVEGATFAAATDRLLASEFGGNAAARERISAAVIGDGESPTTELAPGVSFGGAVVSGIPDSLLFLGTSSAGITVPGTSEPVRLLFLLLTPPECAHEHVRHLAEVARLVRTTEQREHLLQCRTPDVLFDWFRPEAGVGDASERTQEEKAGAVPV